MKRLLASVLLCIAGWMQLAADPAMPSIKLTLSADKTSVAYGSELMVTITAEPDFSRCWLAGFILEVQFDRAKLAFAGTAPGDCVNHEVFDYRQSGTLDDAEGRIGLTGIRLYENAAAPCGSQFVFARIPLRVVTRQMGSATVSLAVKTATAAVCQGDMGRGLSFSAGTLEVKTAPLDISLEEFSGIYEHTYRLQAGWNAIGVPFDFDAEANSLFARLALKRYDPVSGQMVPIEGTPQIKAGSIYWVYVPLAQAEDLTTVKVKGSLSAAYTGTELKAGWNLVTPICKEGGRYGFPEGLTDDIQTWGKAGYETINARQTAQIGQVYWLNSRKIQTIWQ